jgi:hypothetical protein
MKFQTKMMLANKVVIKLVRGKGEAKASNIY